MSCKVSSLKCLVASLQGSHGQVIVILINSKGENGAYHPSIYVVSCSRVQWDGTMMASTHNATSTWESLHTIRIITIISSIETMIIRCVVYVHHYIR